MAPPRIPADPDVRIGVAAATREPLPRYEPSPDNRRHLTIALLPAFSHVLEHDPGRPVLANFRLTRRSYPQTE